MEKSIETTWREGFLSPDALVAPRINDLYNRRSTHIVDKIQRMFKINQVAVVVGAPVQWIFLSAVGIPYTGAIVCVSLLALIGVQKWLFADMERPDNSLNSYQYLKAFQGWLKERMARSRRIQRHLYSVVFLALMLGLGASRGGQALIDSIVEANPNIYLAGGIPVVLLVGVFVVAVVIEFLGGAIFDFDVNTVYRPVFRKLDQMVEDMDELRRDASVQNVMEPN